jgi:hypothetical protein
MTVRHPKVFSEKGFCQHVGILLPSPVLVGNFALINAVPFLARCGGDVGSVLFLIFKIGDDKVIYDKFILVNPWITLLNALMKQRDFIRR